MYLCTHIYWEFVLRSSKFLLKTLARPLYKNICTYVRMRKLKIAHMGNGVWIAVDAAAHINCPRVKKILCGWVLWYTIYFTLVFLSLSKVCVTSRHLFIFSISTSLIYEFSYVLSSWKRRERCKYTCIECVISLGKRKYTVETRCSSPCLSSSITGLHFLLAKQIDLTTE